MTTSPDDLIARFRGGITQEERPWGRFRRFPGELGRALKIITVEPGGTLSLQTHRRRAEFWTVLDEGLEVTVGDRTWRPAEGEEIYIPASTPHRLRSAGPRRGRVMEVWLGDDSGEDDIVRITDEYGRGGR